MTALKGRALLSGTQYRIGGLSAADQARKSIISVTDAMVASRQDGVNFRTNMVTLAEYQDRGAASESAVLGLAAAWACVNLLAGTIASLPLRVYREQGAQRVVASDHPLDRLLRFSPNADQTALDFWEFICACLEMRGNAYAEVERASNGRIIALGTPIPPETVAVRRAGNGSLEYRWTENGRQITRRDTEILHIRGFGGSPLGGLSTLTFGARAFGLAMTVEQSAAATFRNGIRPSGVFQSDEKFAPEQRREAERIMGEKYRGSHNDGTPLLLDRGIKWQTVSIAPEDAQMLQSRAFSVEQICMFFGVPPHMIGHTEKSTSWGTGLEQQTLGFQKFTLRRRLKRIEQALEKQLLTPVEQSQGYRIEFNLEGLLRADTQARGQFYQTMTNMGAMTINEVRALENMPPVPGGDVPRMQMQNVPITQPAPGEGE